MRSDTTGELADLLSRRKRSCLTLSANWISEPNVFYSPVAHQALLGFCRIRSKRRSQIRCGSKILAVASANAMARASGSRRRLAERPRKLSTISHGSTQPPQFALQSRRDHDCRFQRRGLASCAKCLCLLVGALHYRALIAKNGRANTPHGQVREETPERGD